MEKSCIKDFVNYLDDNLYSQHFDSNSVNNAVELLLEFYKKNEIDDEVIEFLSEISDSKKVDDKFDALTVGCYLGLIMGKYSKKVGIQNNGL